MVLLQDEKFEIRNETYRGQQYSQIYFARLHLMRTLLYSLVPNWKPSMPGTILFHALLTIYLMRNFDLMLVFSFFVKFGI